MYLNLVSVCVSVFSVDLTFFALFYPFLYFSLPIQNDGEEQQIFFSFLLGQRGEDILKFSGYFIGFYC